MSDTQKPVGDLEGRELDAAVAEEVMGKQVTWVADDEPHAWSGVGSEPGFQESTKVPAYSTDIAAAWGVVEHFKSAGHLVNVGVSVNFDGEVVGYCSDVAYCGSAYADTAPESICRAALRAVRAAE